MVKKILLGTLGGAVAGNVIAMVIYMGFLGGMAEKWMQDNAACLNEMSPVWWMVAGLVQALLFALILDKFGVSTFKGGLFAGAWLSFLLALFIGIMNASTYKAYGWDWLPLDLIGNVISGAVGGATIGWIFGKVK